MKKGNIVTGLIAGGMLGAAAAVMTVPGYRTIVMKKARCSYKKLMRAAKNYLPI